jgi:hypothetical protein
VPKPAPVAVTSPDTLIRFDRKAVTFLLFLAALYLFAGTAKWHTSSIGNWSSYLKLPKSPTVIAGTPKWTRLDEWATATPDLAGQYRAGLPLSNPAFGAGNVPVVWGFPVRDASSILRPVVWPYFLMDLEHAFSFSWNFNIFFFLASMFLVFLLLTNNHFWLSVFGTFFLFFSSGVQWWSYNISTYMLYLNGMFLAGAYFFYSRKPAALVAAGVVLLFSVYGFLFSLYPPFQLPLVYLYLFLFLGFLLRRKSFGVLRQNLRVKGAVFAGTALVLLAFLYHYYVISKTSYALMMQTVYPGSRMATGGDLAPGKFFAEFFFPFLDESHVPTAWMNISESSGFLVFLPVLIYCILRNYLKERRLDPLELALSVFLVISTVYILAGFPEFLSRMSLLSVAEARRVLLIAGAGNGILLVTFLAHRPAPSEKFSWKEFVLLGIAIAIFLVLVTRHVNAATGGFFTDKQVRTVIFLFTAVYLLIRYARIPWALPALCIILLGFNLVNASVNPLTRGMSAMTENPLTRLTRPLYEKDKTAGWAVFGGTGMAELLKSNGIRVFNGVKFIPPLDDMRFLDAGGGHDSVFNRFAHVKLMPLVTGRDSVHFELTNPDGYTLEVDPCSPRLRQLGIRYVLFTEQPFPEHVRCMVPVDTTSFFLYKFPGE